MFLRAIRKNLSYDPIEILKFKMAAAAILDGLDSGMKYVSVCLLLDFVPENILSSAS